MINIIRYNDKYKNYIIELVLHCQNDGTRPFVNAENQTELFNIEDYFFKDGGYFWLALDDDKLAGTIALKKYNNEVAGLKKFFVWEEYRSNPHYLGQKLYAKFLNYALCNNFKTIVLSTPKNTQRAHNFYKKAGFKLTDKKNIPVTIDDPYSECDYFILEITPDN